MPIKAAAFGGDKTEEEQPKTEEETPAPKPKRSGRRKKEDLIADAVIPANDAEVKVKFTATGTVNTRTWLQAVELFRAGKIEFIDPPDAPSPLKYAVMKMDQQAGGAPEPGPNELDPDSVEGLTKRWLDLQERIDQQHPERDDHGEIEGLSEEAEIVRKKIIEIGGKDPASDEAYAERAAASKEGGADTSIHSGKKGSANVPPDAELGDEVRVGGETLRVGHGNVLTSGPISDSEGNIISPKTTWQRELGSGGEGKWEIVQTHGTGTVATTTTATPPITVTRSNSTAATTEPKIERQVVDPEMREITPGTWKVGTGVLEKIGLPDYSGLQVGPNTMSTTVLDDGRRMKVKMPSQSGEGREVEVPTAVVEAYALLADTVEYVTRLQRGHLIAFLEAVKPGSTQPRQS